MPSLEELAKKMTDAHDSVKENHERMKKADLRIVALEERGKHVPADLKETLGQVQTALATSDEKHVKLAESVADMSKKLTSLNQLEEEVEGKADDAAHQKEFFVMLRKGVQSSDHDTKLLELQQKTMYAASDPDGGYVIPRPVADRIVSDIRESSPVRQFATIVTIGGEEYKYLIDKEEAGAGWVSERQARTQTGTPQIQQGNIPAHEMYANPFVTQKQLDDAGFDLEGWLNGKVANKFGRLEATAFLLGSGVGQPRGILTYADGTDWGKIERIASGNADLITSDSLILLQNALKAEYGNGAAFMMRRQTVGAVRLLKDGQGNYIWQPGLQAGEPSSVLGDPIIRMADMPTVAAGTLPIGYGNLRETYTIVDRLAIRVLRDPYSNKPYVEFYTTKRVGGDVTNFESMKLLEIKA